MVQDLLGGQLGVAFLPSADTLTPERSRTP